MHPLVFQDVDDMTLLFDGSHQLIAVGILLGHLQGIGDTTCCTLKRIVTNQLEALLLLLLREFGIRFHKFVVQVFELFLGIINSIPNIQIDDRILENQIDHSAEACHLHRPFQYEIQHLGQYHRDEIHVLGMQRQLHVGIEMLHSFAVQFGLVEHLLEEIDRDILAIGGDEDIGQRDRFFLHRHVERGRLTGLKMNHLLVGAISHERDFDGTFVQRDAVQKEVTLLVTNRTLPCGWHIDGCKRSGMQRVGQQDSPLHPMRVGKQRFYTQAANRPHAHAQ